MEFVISLLNGSYPYLFVSGFFSRAAWVVTFLLLLFSVVRLRKYQGALSRRSALFLPGLLLLTAATSLFIGVRIPLSEPVPLEGLIGLQTHLVWMIFSAVPVFLAAGFSGPGAAFFIGLLTGASAAYFQTHNPFTALEFGFYGIFAAYLLRQPYRTRFFRLVARPTAAAVLLSLLVPLVYLAGTWLWLENLVAAGLDRAFILLFPTWTAVAGSFLVAGILCEAVAVQYPRRWGGNPGLRPSPAERSLAARSFSLIGLLTALLVLVLSAVGWFVAYRSARELIQDRMEGAAALAADNVPTLLEIGQDLAISAAQSPALVDADSLQQADELQRLLQEYGYFSQFLLVRPDLELLVGPARLTGFPSALTQPEDAGIELALAGVPFQYYTSAQTESGVPAFVSFLVALPEQRGVLIGRMAFTDNTFTAPLIAALENLRDQGGAGILVDETRHILYHPVAEMIGTEFQRRVPAGEELTETLSSDGTRVFAYGLPASGRSWTVVIEIPVSAVQQLAVRIAGPLVGLLLALAAGTILLLRVILRLVTGSLGSLAREANRIAENPRYLDTPLEVRGVDEVGEMRLAFERMRSALKVRMDEQQQLLLASHGAAGSLQFDVAVRPILGAALATGAATARIVLAAGVLPDKPSGEPAIFSAGPDSGRFNYLDSQVLALNEGNDPLVLRNPVGSAKLAFPPNEVIPGTIVGVSLKQEARRYGVLWIAFNDRQTVTGDQVRFLSTLGAQAVLAAANARLFSEAETGRERLAAILASTPDPVIVTDEEGLLLLANPAAWEVLGEALSQGSGRPVRELLEDADLVSLLSGDQEEALSMELTLSDGQVYFVKATAVLSQGRQVGRIGVLRDVTHFKEVDQLKSDLVSNVSHDLNRPLTVIKGFNAMLPIVGDLNEEQVRYVEKISLGVDRMTTIVEDLLYLGRLESEVPLNIEAFFPQQVLQQAAEMSRPFALEKEIEMVVLRKDTEDRLMKGDRSLIERALGNLIDNAIKYTPKGGRVEVSALFDRSGKNVIYSVKDNGYGILPAHQERLFERFYRVPTRESHKQPGNGLGLSIVRLTAERHAGKVQVESKIGVGSVFQMIIPAEPPETGQMEES